MRRLAFSQAALLVALVGCGPARVEVTERRLELTLLAGSNHWSSSVTSTTSRYPNGDVTVSNVPDDALAMIAAAEHPAQQPPLSLRLQLDQTDTAVRIELPFPLSDGQILPVRAVSLRTHVAEIGPAVDAVGLELAELGCPPAATVVVGGVETIDPTKCDPPLAGTLTGRLAVTATAPLTLDVDATLTLARSGSDDVHVQGQLSTTLNEHHSSWSD
jgi:hypothetical protein